MTRNTIELIADKAILIDTYAPPTNDRGLRLRAIDQALDRIRNRETDHPTADAGIILANIAFLVEKQGEFSIGSILRLKSR